MIGTDFGQPFSVQFASRQPGMRRMHRQPVDTGDMPVVVEVGADLIDGQQQDQRPSAQPGQGAG